MNSGRIVKKILLSFIVLVLMFISFLAGSYLVSKNDIVRGTIVKDAVYLGGVLGKHDGSGAGRLSQDVDFDLFWQAWDTLTAQYVDKDKLNEKKMFYGAIRGMVASLGDPYTVFMDPKIAQDFSDELAGTFEGIGAEIGIKDETITVIAPLPDMPAEKAGLKAGDKIMAIDKEPTIGMSVDEAVYRIRGARDTSVVLSVWRDDFEEVKDFTITRGIIIIKSIKTELRTDNIFVIQITNFNEDTQRLFGEAASEAINKNPAGVILDLRNNPGGFLDTAIEVASEWVEDGIIVTEKYSDDKKIEHLARGRSRLKTYPTVVLVNEGSASASEIVAGALQDYGLGTVIGQKTFGKGSVQTLTDFSDGSSIKITVAKWLTPKGRSINDEGVIPDESVDYAPEDYDAGVDPQLIRAVEILTGQGEPAPDSAASSTAEDVLPLE